MNRQLDQLVENFRRICGKENKITSYQLYNGIQILFVSMVNGNFSFHPPAFGHILEINYCRSGRIGWQMGNGDSIYLGQSDFSLHTLDSCTDSAFSLPNGVYEGLTILIDLDELSQNPPALLAETGLSGIFLREKFCKDTDFTSLSGNEQTEAIFSAFYNLPENLQLPYWKLKTLELLLYLFRLEIDTNRHLTAYQAQQIEIIRSIHEQLVGNLNQRFTIAALSRQYLMNPTTLKKVFKAVYGTSIAAHIKMHRMEQAAKLLRETRDDILRIAQSVGYESQSKFSAAFKEYFQMLPTDYRRKYLTAAGTVSSRLL